MDSFVSRLQKLREDRLLTYKKIADAVGIDQGLLCKIEKGQRPATKDQVIKLADFFNVNRQELMTEWLSDKLAYEVEGEPTALKALQLAEEKVKYTNQQKGKR